MPKFSATSLARLEQCDPRLQAVFRAVVERVDCAILVGHRSELEQEAVFTQGRSKLRWPESRHNRWLSWAVDAAPYPIDWQDSARFALFAGYVLAVADGMGVPIRWGGDWDRDFRVADNEFDDLVHFEIV